MDCLLGRRSHKKRNHDRKKLRPVSAEISPAHSQPSTLVTTPRSTLPQVSSSGLWRHNPGVYAVPPEFYYSRPVAYGVRPPDYPHAYPMARAISESRIPQPGSQQFPYRASFMSQNNLYWMPPPHQRFYHSQHLAPVMEQPTSRGMEIYDYPFIGDNGGYRSKMLETKHTPAYYSSNSEFILRKVERSHSDADQKEAYRPPSAQRQNPPQRPHQNQHPVGMQPNAWQPSRPHEPANQFTPAPYMTNHPNGYGNSGRINPAFSSDTGVAPKTQQDPSRTTGLSSSKGSGSEKILSSAATDSMKLLAKNKTDDQKTSPSFTTLAKDTRPAKTDVNDNESDNKHYVYDGSIYAVPQKHQDEQNYDNPIVRRIKEMVAERNRHSQISESTADLNSGPSPAAQNGSTALKSNHISNGEHKIISEKKPAGKWDVLDGISLPDTLDTEEEVVKVSKLKSAGRDYTKPAGNQLRVHGSSPRPSLDTESGVDDINKAGKQLATSAFQFLDNYLSDDEGTESLVESPPLSPKALKA